MFSVGNGGLSCLRVFGEPAGGARLRVKRCVKRVPAADEAPRLHERAEKIKHRQQGWGGNRRRCRGGGRGVFISLPTLSALTLCSIVVGSGAKRLLRLVWRWIERTCVSDRQHVGWVGLVCMILFILTWTWSTLHRLFKGCSSALQVSVSLLCVLLYSFPCLWCFPTAVWAFSPVERYFIVLMAVFQRAHGEIITT